MHRIFTSLRFSRGEWFGLCVALCLLGCRREAVDSDPERLVVEFLFRMKRVHGDPKNGREAFELLWSQAQKNLAERAVRASALAGRKMSPEEMIAPSRFSLRFEPRRLHWVQHGEMAVVTVQGDPPQRETREIRCIREDSRWRIVLELPELPQIQKRPETIQGD
jgi:hypothetical protein